MAKYAAGDRVAITGSHEWGSGGTGTVGAPPFAVTDRTGAWGDGVTRVEGSIVVYWVEFDVPILDCTEDGPYLAGTVEEYALSLI